MGQHRQESWIACVILLFKYQLNTQRNSKIGFLKSHFRHLSHSLNVTQRRRPNGPLLTLQLKFHVAAFVVVVAQKLEPYDSFSVTKVVLVGSIVTASFLALVEFVTFDSGCHHWCCRKCSSSEGQKPPRRGRGVLPYMSYIGMCCCEGYGFQAVCSRIGYINQSVCF